MSTLEFIRRWFGGNAKAAGEDWDMGKVMAQADPLPGAAAMPEEFFSDIIHPSVPEADIEVPREESLVLPTLSEVAQVVTGQAKTGELVGIVRQWRPGDPIWAVMVDHVAYARIDGKPIDSDTMFKAGYRPPFKFVRMAPGGWRPNDHKEWRTHVDAQGRTVGGYYWKDDGGPSVEDKEIAERRRQGKDDGE